MYCENGWRCRRTRRSSRSLHPSPRLDLPATIRRVLVANRGEIAVRIVRACRDEGLESIVAVSEADQDSLAARLATDVVHIGPASPAQSYLRVEQVVAAAL